MPNEKMMNRIEWIDTAKGIGILLVVLGHLSIPYVTAWIYTFHMPLFFFLSGVVFSGKKYSFQEYLTKRVKSLIIPYFSLGLIIWLFFVIINAVIGAENGMYGTNLEMLKGLFVQEHFWTIWFLSCLFLVEIIYYTIDKISKDNLYISTIICVIICAIGLLRYRLRMGSLPWNLDVALVAQFFFHLGYCFKNNQWIKEKTLFAKGYKAWLRICIFFMVNFVAGVLCIKLANESLDMSVGLYGNEFLTIISACAGILGTVILAKQLRNKYLIYLGRNTMILFAWHSRIVIVLCQYVYKYLEILQSEDIFSRLIYSVLTGVVIFIILIPINEIIKKSRFHKVFGV